MSLESGLLLGLRLGFFLFGFFLELIDCNNEWSPEIGWSGGSRPAAGFKVLVGFKPSQLFQLLSVKHPESKRDLI